MSRALQCFPFANLSEAPEIPYKGVASSIPLASLLGSSQIVSVRKNNPLSLRFNWV
jgi:hypothetical protein